MDSSDSGDPSLRNDGIGNHEIISADNLWASGGYGRYIGKNSGMNVYRYAFSPISLLYPYQYPTSQCFCKDSNVYYNVDQDSIRCIPGEGCGACYPRVLCTDCGAMPEGGCLTDPYWR